MKEKRTIRYIEIYKEIKDRIEKEIYKTGSLLPCESELQAEFSASRTTIRRAVDLLKKDGLISVMQGYGTLVKKKRVSQSLNTISSVAQSFLRSGYSVGVKNMSIERVYATEEIAGELKIKIGTPIILISRIQTANNIPVTVAKNYIPEKYVPGLIDEKAEIVSLYKYIREKYALEITKIEDKISACNADFDESVMLETEPKTALITVRRVCFSKEGPFEVDFVKIIASKYEYKSFLEEKK